MIYYEKTIGTLCTKRERIDKNVRKNTRRRVKREII